MHDSEYDSVVWDTSTPDNQEGSSSNNAGGQTNAGSSSRADKKDNAETSPLIPGANNDNSSSSTHTSPFGRIGDDGIDDVSGSHFGAGGAGAPFDVAYGGDSVGGSSARVASAGESSSRAAARHNANADDDQLQGDVETQVAVDEARKEGEGTSNPYVTYLVTTTRTQKQTREVRRYALRRRFQDFVWLHDQLSKQFMACAIPPLPGKRRLEYITGDRFSVDFVTKRKHGLERFLQRVLLHPVLRTSQHLTVFLEAKDWSSEYEVKQPGKRSESPSVLDALGDTLLNTFSKVRKRDERFVEMRESIARLEENLTRIQKLYLRVTKRQMGLQKAYEELGTGLSDLGDIETGMTMGLVEAGNALKSHHLALKDLATQTEDLFLGEVEEYISYCEAYLELLKLRDQKQAEFEDLTEFLQQAIAERDRLKGHQSAVGISAVTNFIKGKVRDLRGVDPAVSRQQRIENLVARIAELESVVDSSSADSEALSELVANDYEVFAHIKQHDFKRAFGALASAHIDFYSRTVDIWKAVIPELEKLPVE
ncbi:intercellular trafficking and secretion [Coemansia sp. RSA 1813]|nr:intercellular trafficking and secretion [Coemansia sp. RSA 1646]KAJ1772161.1 intercellular trafficking and secretion [Coemansia sp. RSA 1843]KAJ2091721.1 intercellular trafficking and secretion [Coemansia sp. RSA 986]KAJ2216876.1 intercellular trafficking and secretion [Coemansia sp. RSA 487]KAJ2571878.1 intercellular trafficking and secretion [Coemansia sp. RSA 1813]